MSDCRTGHGLLVGSAALAAKLWGSLKSPVAKLRAFYLAACGAGHADGPTAVRDVLGADPAALLARWKQWLVRGA